MLAEVEQIYTDSLEKLDESQSTAALENWHRDTLGRKGQVTLLTRQVGQLSNEERPLFGKRINEVKRELETAYENRLAGLKAAELEAQMSADKIDVTLPGRRPWRGRLHPATQT